MEDQRQLYDVLLFRVTWPVPDVTAPTRTCKPCAGGQVHSETAAAG